MTTEELLELSFNEALTNLKKGKKIFPKRYTKVKKIETLEKLLDYATKTEKYEECSFLNSKILELKQSIKK